MSASLIESFLTPTSAIMTVADYGIEKETGKKVSEHALSMATSQDCKFNLKEMTICKDENLANKKIIKVAKANQNSSKKTKIASLTN
jgi:predicted acetyltransferase